MKNFLLLIIAAILGAGIAGAVLMLAVNPSAKASPETVGLGTGSVSTAQPGSSRDEVAKLKTTVDQLAAQVTQIANELDRLHGSADRAPATSAETHLKPSDDELATLSPKARDEVLDVLNQEFKRQEDQRAAQRLEKDRAAAQRRAERVAKDLSLNANDTVKLADYYLVANQKRRDMFTAMQDGDVDRETMMQNFQDMRDWQKDELNKQFGAAVAEQLMQQDNGRWGGGPGFGGGPGGRQGGGQFPRGGRGPGGGGNGNGGNNNNGGGN